MMYEQRRRAALACAALTVLSSTSRAGAQEKLKPEEVVARHLAAVGSAEARSAQRPRVAAGDTRIEVKAGGRGGSGGEGLIGGVLSTAWPLLRLEGRGARLSHAGAGEVAGRPAHRLRYAPRKGSDLKVTLFFDAETFRHVRTEYEHTVPAPIGATPGQSVSQRETRYRLVEEFDDFKTEGGLTLPRAYTVGYTVFSTGTPLEVTWKFNLTRVTHDQQIDPRVFVADAAEK